MKIKMFNENNEIEIVEIGSERHKTLSNLAEIAIKELDIRALKKENKQLKEQLAIRDKALKYMHEMIKLYVKELFDEEAFSIEHYIEQAKESIK